MATVHAEIVERLCDLLRDEQAGPLAFLAAAGPYIGPAAQALRWPLRAMIAQSQRHEAELASRIDELGGTPRCPSVAPDRQYLAYLGVESLLPVLAEAKRKSIARHQAILSHLGPCDPAATRLLGEHLEDHRRDLAWLEKALEELKS